MYQVLIADDEPMIRHGMAKILRWEDYGFTVAALVESGQAAVEACARSKIDLILMDIRMPGMDGLHAIEQIKQFYPQTMIIVLTGYSEFEYARRGIDLGVQKYLLKPVNLTELKNALKSAKIGLDSYYSQKRTAYSDFVVQYADRTDKPVIRKMVYDIAEDLRDAVSLEQLGERYKLSPVYLSQLFKKEIGINFIDWFTMLRIEKAKELLLDVTLKTYEVASAVGYDDVRYFGQIFKRITGMTPNTYRKKRML